MQFSSLIFFTFISATPIPPINVKPLERMSLGSPLSAARKPIAALRIRNSANPALQVTAQTQRKTTAVAALKDPSSMGHANDKELNLFEDFLGRRKQQEISAKDFKALNRHPKSILSYQVLLDSLLEGEEAVKVANQGIFNN